MTLCLLFQDGLARSRFVLIKVVARDRQHFKVVVQRLNHYSHLLGEVLLVDNLGLLVHSLDAFNHRANHRRQDSFVRPKLQSTPFPRRQRLQGHFPLAEFRLRSEQFRLNRGMRLVSLFSLALQCF